MALGSPQKSPAVSCKKPKNTHPRPRFLELSLGRAVLVVKLGAHHVGRVPWDFVVRASFSIPGGFGLKALP